jgi:hypothetical protein
MANVVTNVGLGLVTAAMAASSNKYLAWGTDDDPAAAVADTALNAESAEDRTTGTQSQQQTTTADDTYRVVGTITATDTRAIVEMGVFSADDAGSMLGRATFPAVNLAASDSIAFTCNFVFDQA